MTRRLLVLILGLTLLSAAAERSYAEQGCRGCDIRTAVVINRALSTQAESGSTNPLHDPVQIDQIMKKYEQKKKRYDWIKNALWVVGLTVDEVVSEIGGAVPLRLAVPSVIASASEVLVRVATAKAMMHLTEKMDESARMILADGLKQYRQQHNEDFSGLLKIYNQGEIPAKGAFDLLFSKNLVYSTILDSVRSEDQHVVNKFMCLLNLLSVLRCTERRMSCQVPPHELRTIENEMLPTSSPPTD